MAKANKKSTFKICIKNDPEFTGKDAGIHFLRGEATTESRWMAEWFEQRPDIYEVTEVTEPAEAAE